MKKILLLSVSLSLGLFATAQQPETKDVPKISGETKVTFSSASTPLGLGRQDDRIHLSQSHLVYGKDNAIQFSVDGIADNSLIVKVISENLCACRKGSKFGEYILTPKAESGSVTVRVGYMDVLGAYCNIGNVDLFIGICEHPEEGEGIPANHPADSLSTDSPSPNPTVIIRRTTTTIEETTVQ